MKKIHKAHNWWEKLTHEQMQSFLKGKTWSGSIEEREKRLLKFYNKSMKR